MPTGLPFLYRFSEEAVPTRDSVNHLGVLPPFPLALVDILREWLECDSVYFGKRLASPRLWEEMRFGMHSHG